MISCRVILILLMVTFISSCNSMFYYPMREVVYQPYQFEIDSEDIEIKTPDGEVLQGWHLLSKSFSKKIVVLQLHGNAENRSTHFLSLAWLVMSGVDVVTFDYRGYDGSTGNPSRKGLVVDALAAIKWVEDHYPNHKKFVLGQSLGGALAITAMAKPRMQERWQGIILESTFHSYQGLAQIKFANSWLLWCFQWLPYVLLTGNEDPIDAASSIRLPVLVFHALEDPVVAYESGKLLYDELTKYTKVTEIDLPGNRHAAAFMEPKSVSRKILRKFLRVGDD